MIRQFGLNLLFLTIAGSFGTTSLAEAQQPEDLAETLTGSLTISVTDLRDTEGNICLKLFSGSEGFPNDDENALQIACVPIAPPTESAPPDAEAVPTPEPVPESSGAEPTPEASQSTEPGFRYTFDELPYGNYAVAIYHDRNGDERLNRGLFGMPEEGYGFSNDAPASFGPADFDDAVFALESREIAIPIEMRYP